MVKIRKVTSCETCLVLVGNAISYSLILIREVSGCSFSFLSAVDWCNKYAVLFEVRVTYAD